jgi:hypothetical protein
VTALLDIFLTLGLLWALVRVAMAARARGKDPHVWGEFESSQVVKILDKKRRGL